MNHFSALLRNGAATLSLGTVLLAVIVAILAPVLAPKNPNDIDLGNMLAAPSVGHPLGTDELGRDLLSRVIFGSRLTLAVGFVSVLLSGGAGITFGMIAGYFGGFVGNVIMRFTDLLLAFPAILLAILAVSVAGPGLYGAMIAIAVARAPVFVRLAAAVTASIAARDFVDAARAIGAPTKRIVLRHVLPSGLAPFIVQASLSFGHAVLTAATLGFLGLGVQPPTAEWGTMVSSGKLYLQSAPHVSLVPGIAITVVVLALNLVGDAIRDVLDPKRQS